jgi:hypothetical protein
VRVKGEQVGHVTTAEYGSQMLSIGGVRHLTGGGKKEGVVTCETLLTLCNKGAVEMSVDGGASLTIQAGRPPVINGVPRSACASAAAPPPSASSPSSGRAMPTKSSSSTTTSRAY